MFPRFLHPSVWQRGKQTNQENRWPKRLPGQFDQSELAISTNPLISGKSERLSTHHPYSENTKQPKKPEDYERDRVEKYAQYFQETTSNLELCPRWSRT